MSSVYNMLNKIDQQKTRETFDKLRELEKFSKISPEAQNIINRLLSDPDFLLFASTTTGGALIGGIVGGKFASPGIGSMIGGVLGGLTGLGVIKILKELEVKYKKEKELDKANK